MTRINKPSFELAFRMGCLLLMIGSAFGLKAQSNHLEFMEDHPNASFSELQEMVEDYYSTRDKGRGTGYKQWKRYEYRMADRVGPSGQAIDVSRNLLEAQKDVDQRYGTRATHGYWQFASGTDYTNEPDGYNGGIGRINTVDFHPTNPDIIYAGQSAGGLWRSTNGGTTWTNLTDGLPNLGVSAVQIDPVNPSIVYLLTGDGNAGHTTSIGVLKSYNGGDTWWETGLSFDVQDGQRLYKLRMHPTDNTILFAVGNNGVYKTENAGGDWDTVRTGSYRDIEFKPDNPNVMYLSGVNFYYRSTDGGNSFSTITSVMPTTGSNRIEMAVTPADPDYLYLVYGGSTGLRAVYRSTDGGLTFAWRSSSPNILGYAFDGSDNRSQSGSDLDIVVNPNSRTEVLVGGINIWKSTDGADNWTPSSHWREDLALAPYVHADIRWMKYNPLDDRLYVGCDGGVFVSRDHGATWGDISSGLGIGQYYRIATTPQDANLIYGGTQDNGSNRVTKFDATIAHVLGADGMETMIDYTDSDVVYVTTQNGSLYKSTNGATNFGGNIAPDTFGAWVTPFLMDPLNPDTLFGGYLGVWRSFDGGSNWTNIGGGASDYLRYMAQGTNNRNRLYAADQNELRMTSTALTASPSWSNITPGLPVSLANISWVEVNPSWSLDVYVSFSGFEDGIKIYHSPDAGTTWNNISGSLPNVPVNCIEYEPGSNGGLYIGTDIGVFYRNDDIGDWIPFRNGMPAVEVREIEYNSAINQLVAATFGRGIWVSSAYNPCPANYTLTDANNPNPWGGYKLYEASNTVTSTREITGGLGTNITYKAANSIQLNPGFRVRSNSHFEANIDDCTADAFIPDPSDYRGVLAGQMPSEEDELFVPETMLESMSLYPNPASNQTTLEFTIAEDREAVFFLADLNGKVLLENRMGELVAGTHTMSINLQGLASGVYYGHLLSGTDRQTKELVIIAE